MGRGSGSGSRGGKNKSGGGGAMASAETQEQLKKAALIGAGVVALGTLASLAYLSKRNSSTTNTVVRNFLKNQGQRQLASATRPVVESFFTSQRQRQKSTIKIENLLNNL